MIFAAFLVVTFAIDKLLFSYFDFGTLFWNWTKPRPRFPAILFIAAISAALALLAAVFRRATVRLSGRGILAASVVAAIILTGLVASAYLLYFPNSGDEYAYYFQALTFEAGRLWNPAPAQGPVVAASFTWVANGRWVGQYPPTWPAMIAAADALGLPVWLLNAVLLALAAVLLYAIIRRDASAVAAGLAAAVFLLAPFTLFQAASFFSHLFASFLVVLTAWAYRRAIIANQLLYSALAGGMIGVLANTRSSSAVVVAIPIGLALLLQRRWRHLIAIGAAGVPFVLLVLAYQHAITGDMFKPVYYFGGRTIDHLYFDTASIKEGAKSTIGKLSELSLWTCPVLVPIWAYGIYLKLRRRTFDATDAIFSIALLLFVFYPIDPGNRYGPRYYFEFWPLMLATIGTSLPLASERVRRWLAPVAIGAIAYALILLPFLGAQYRTIVEQRTDPFRQAATRHLAHAVICIDYDYGLLPLGGSDYARNGIDTNHSVLFADCIGLKAAQVRRLFPGYELYYYRHPRGQDAGEIVKL